MKNLVNFFKEKSMTALKGIIAPFTTPFKANGEIDLTLIKPQVDWLIDNGVHGFAILLVHSGLSSICFRILYSYGKRRP